MPKDDFVDSTWKIVLWCAAGLAIFSALADHVALCWICFLPRGTEPAGTVLAMSKEVPFMLAVTGRKNDRTPSYVP